MKLTTKAHGYIGMTLLGQSRSRRLMLAVTVSGICAATLAAPSRADDDAAAPPSPFPTEIAAVPGLGESAPAIVADAIETATTALEETSQAADAGDPEEEAGSDGIPSNAGNVSSPVDTGADDDAGSDENAPSQAPSEVDTTPSDGDTASDSTELAPSKDDPTSATEATAPPTSSKPTASPPTALNVNVSVRFDSAGDNGAVTQLNAATAAPARTSGGQSPTPASAPTTPERYGRRADPTGRRTTLADTGLELVLGVGLSFCTIYVGDTTGTIQCSIWSDFVDVDLELRR